MNSKIFEILDDEHFKEEVYKFERYNINSTICILKYDEYSEEFQKIIEDFLRFTDHIEYIDEHHIVVIFKYTDELNAQKALENLSAQYLNGKNFKAGLCSLEMTHGDIEDSIRKAISALKYPVYTNSQINIYEY